MTQDLSTSSAVVLSVDQLGFSYSQSSSPVLDGLDLELTKGDLCLLVGANGSGKTTCLRLLKPEVAPAGSTRGSVRVCGVAPADMSVSQSASTIGYVSQDPASQLVCDVVWHEIAFGLEQLGTPAPEMRRRVAQVASFLGIEHLMERACDTLSGGEAQLVALAASAVMEPALLLLDEPTSALDPVAADTFAHALFRLTRRLGICALVATHSPEAWAAYATCAVELTCGKLKPRDLALLQKPQPLLPLTADKNLALQSFIQAVWGQGSLDWGAQGGLNRGDKGDKGTDGKSDEHDALDRKCLWTDELWFRYARREPWVLRGVGLEVLEGHCMCLLGGNGSGKSTLVSSAAGLVKPQIGRWHSSGSAVGYLPQEPELLLGAASVFEELTGSNKLPSDEELSALVARGAQVDAAPQVAPEALALAKLFGLETLLGTDPLDLSGGQRQLVALAKVVLSRRPLLLLDEPTQGLDAGSRAAVTALLLEVLARGTTLVLVTHDMAFAQALSSEVSFMFAGEVASTLPAQEYFAKSVFFGAPECV